MVCIGVFLIGRCLYTICLNIFLFKQRSFFTKIIFKFATPKYAFTLQELQEISNLVAIVPRTFKRSKAGDYVNTTLSIAEIPRKPP